MMGYELVSQQELPFDKEKKDSDNWNPKSHWFNMTPEQRSAYTWINAAVNGLEDAQSGVTVPKFAFKGYHVGLSSSHRAGFAGLRRIWLAPEEKSPIILLESLGLICSPRIHQPQEGSVDALVLNYLIPRTGGGYTQFLATLRQEEE